MIEHIVAAINKHTIALYKQKDFPQTLVWFFNMFVDACHSGSALTEGKKWALKYSGRKIMFDNDIFKEF
jgi:hypothetical protein